VSVLSNEQIHTVSIGDSTLRLEGTHATTISIVVPVSPNSDLIDLVKLLDSVFKQNFSCVEVLILSEDTSKWSSLLDNELRSDVVVRLLQVPAGTGASAARNRGAVTATGNVLAFLDDDVILCKRWCERCVTALSDSSVGAVTGRVLVRLEEYGLDFVPESLKWVVGGTYWDSKVPISVFSAAGMNFCIKKEVYLKAGGYDENLGPRGDRPEKARWHRLGAEESDLAIRIWLRTGLKVVYDPNVIVEHKLRPESILPGGLVRRALHVGHNRAYIHSKYPRLGVVNDNQTFKRLVKELTFTAKKFIRNPVRVWQSFSFTFLVVIAFGAGFLEGLLHYRHLSLAVNE
jgi:glycosyltransferase involved in cell wall biosynthesis